jgi:phenylacetate-CoA ligase
MTQVDRHARGRSPRSEDLQRVWEQRFQRMMDYVCAAHPYYRDVMRRCGLSRHDFGCLEDLRRLPVTTKQHYMADPDAFRLRSECLPDLSLPERTLWGAVYTTGSTAGRPTPFYDTAYDHVARVWQMRAATEMAGITPADVIANCFPLTTVPHQGFLSALYGPLAVGAMVFTGFTGRRATPFPVCRSTEDLLRLIVTHRATVLWGITSYVRRLVLTAGTLGLDLSSVRVVFVAGEPCPPGMRADLHRRLARLGATNVCVQNGYGCTEMQGPTIECAEGGPLHVPAPEQYWFEVVDPSTHTPLPEGSRGLVLLTHLNRRGTVLLRYAIGDLTAMATGPCEVCGRDGPRFVLPPQRGDALIKLRGTLLNPMVLIETVSGVAGVDDFQIAAACQDPRDPLAGEELVVRFTGPPEEAATVRETIAQAVRSVCELTPRVVYLSPEAFAALDDADVYKFRRFRDERRAAATEVLE